MWSAVGRLAVVALVLAASSCGGGGGGQGCTVSGVSVVAEAAAVFADAPDGVTASVTSSGPCTSGVDWSASPAGGTLTPSGLTASFSSSVPGTYTVTATSKADATRSGSVQIVVRPPCGLPSGTIVSHTGQVNADETWEGYGVTHEVPGGLRINAPATVTIEPCAIVSLGASQGIQVNGDSAGMRTAKLLVAGSDDANGFVSFVPSGAAPWGFLQGVNERSLIELHHAKLTLAGGGGTFSNGAAIWGRGPGLHAQPMPTVLVDHVVVDTPVGGGVFLDSEATFDPASGPLTVKGASSWPIEGPMMAAGTVPPFTGQDNLVHDFYVGDNADVFADLTIGNRIPVRIVTGQVNVKPAGGASGTVTLTLLPGATLLFGKPSPSSIGARVLFGTAGGGIEGNLVAVGTALEPITITSGEASPAPGDWSGLQLIDSPGSQLAYVTVAYAGGFSGWVTTNCKPTGTADAAAIIVGGAPGWVPDASLLANSTISDSAGFGIDAIWANSTFDTPDLSSGNTFTGNAGCNQTYNGCLAGTCTCPAGGGCLP